MSLKGIQFFAVSLFDGNWPGIEGILRKEKALETTGSKNR
jgi:hypothetical protein